VKFLDRFFGRKSAQLTYDQIASLIDDNSGASIAGVPVTNKSALGVSTVLACVKVLADGCATPVLQVFREKADGSREKAVRANDAPIGKTPTPTTPPRRQKT
jgi:phage portal protein BeeE